MLVQSRVKKTNWGAGVASAGVAHPVAHPVEPLHAEDLGQAAKIVFAPLYAVQPVSGQWQMRPFRNFITLSITSWPQRVSAEAYVPLLNPSLCTPRLSLGGGDVSAILALQALHVVLDQRCCAGPSTT